MAEMNDLAKRWVAALRSGQYKQGKHVLRSIDNKFCCLGVLADVANPNCWGKITPVGYAGLNAGEVFLVKGYEADDNSPELISNELWDAVTEGALFKFSDDELATANDEGRTFEQIIQEYISPMWDDEWEGQEPRHD